MPLMDGIETAKIMRSNPISEHIPIIFLTAYNKDEINMLQGYKVGAIDYLFKPINEDILLSKVRTFLRSYAFEKEKEYEKILFELESQNKKLEKARKEALQMMEDANRARSEAQLSRRQIEEQAHELMLYTKELEQFAYVATHDLRAPVINLNAIFDIFKKRKFITPENKDIVDRIDGSLERINITLDDLIETISYKKVHKGEVKEIRIEELFNSVKNDLDTQIKTVNAEIVYDFSKASEIHYIAGHLRSIFQNLITNSLKYHSEKRTPHISVSTDWEKDYFCLLVKDNGIGIEGERKDKVFGLFQRLTTNASGKGMGLYITKTLIESMGGTIDFTSQLGEGTEFKVKIKNLSN